VRSRPIRLRRWPSCTTNVRTPKPTNADRMVVTAAFPAMTSERKPMASSRNVTPTMYRRKYGMRERMRFPMSRNAAVLPET
jgi:hypothetical protein